MEIVIENCSSPGAQFSNNTNNVLLKIYEWIDEKDSPVITFIDFRRSLEADKKINDNNARNIYPLLKNSGLVDYQAGGQLATKNFFTNRGLAYIKALETKALIEKSNYSPKQKKEAMQQVDEMMSSIIFDSLEKLVTNKELNYSEGLRWYLMFLHRYGKISRQEFAYMVYQMKQDAAHWEEKTDGVINSYRNNEIEINVKVRVRNDQKIQMATGEETRLEEISYFTAYNYYSALVNQAGITRKVSDYYMLIENKGSKLAILLEV